MSLTRIHNLSISLDGFATGEPQSADAPFGHAGQRLHQWMIATRFWAADGSTGVDNAFAERHSHGIGAEIMGANKFGPPGWQDDPGWTGWWGYDDLANTCSFGPSYCPIEGFWQRVSATPYSVPGPAPLSLLVVGLAALGLVRTRQRSR